MNQINKKGKVRLLIVDDDSMVLFLYQEYFEELDFVVTTCRNSKDALALFKENPDQFDAVLTDYSMPEMTGSHLSQEILGIRNNLPIILVTGYDNLFSEEEAKNIGISYYLQKPFEFDRLEKIVMDCLKPA
jgi:DNA-binding NtrC family response regulator